MTTTGYSDLMGRTVSGGLGTATSGQAYTLFGTASQFSVAPNVASIAPTSSGDKIGYVDVQTTDIDITAQVALSAIPATALATVGFVGKLATISNYYNATMMVAAGGAISLRFSKVIGGGLSTIATVATGLTYVANTFYNLRFVCRWSQTLQTNVLLSKLWLTTAPTQPGGWQAVTTDNSITNYTSGTQFGIMGRDEQASPSVTAKIQNVVMSSYNLPIPATADPMCYDPSFTFPKQTALESLADATDAAMATLDPLTSLAGLFPRVRVSNSLLSINTASISINVTYAATEFNVGTTTNLGYDSTGIYLPVGIWAVLFEIQLAESASDYLIVNVNDNGNAGNTWIDMRQNPVQANDRGVGGTGRMSKTVISTDPTTPARVSVTLSPNNVATTYTATYLALSAIKISDYFV